MEKILIVEDDALIARLYQKAFSFDNYEVEVVTDGRLALEMLKKFKPSLVLMDIMMPRMSGYEVLKTIKADSSFRNIPVVMLTNLSDKDSVNSAKNNGADGFIVKGDHKPLDIVRMVKEVLNGNGGK